MSLLIIALLIVVAVVLLLIELFLIPGFGIAGIAALACLAYANYAAFIHFGLQTGGITLVASVVVCVVAVRWFMHSRTLDRLSLKQDISSKVERPAQGSITPGMKGTTLTRLALIGKADFGGRIVEVKSADGFLNEKTPVVVLRIVDGMPEVGRDNAEPERKA